MGISRGNITTNIIKSGLVFNMDAANRASYPRTGTTATDTIGSINGTINGASFETINNGVFGFDGSDDYIDCNTTLESWVEDANKSFFAWVKNDGNTSTARIFGAAYQDINALTGFGLGIKKTTNNKPFYFFRTSAGSALYEEFGDVLNTTDWYHFAFSIDGTTNEAYIYQNGVLKVTVSNVGNPSQTSVQTAKIGKHWDSTINQYFDGNIANIHLYNRALSSTEVLHNYNALKGRFE